MKKTLITLAVVAASMASTAFADALTMTPPTTLTQEFTWTLTGSVTVGQYTGGSTNQWGGSVNHVGEYGTAVFATGSNPFADTYNPGMQLYVQSGKANNNDASRDCQLVMKFNSASEELLQKVSGGDVIGYTFSFDSKDKEFTATVSINGSAIYSDSKSYTNTFSIDALSTSASSNGWSASAVTVTKPGSGTDSVPEPTTATLSLLALAGLAARRRRK